MNDLAEKAEDLWLEKERLESVAENAIAAGAPDANAAELAADEATSAALRQWIAMEAQTAKKLDDNERDERAQMTSVERATKVVERDPKHTQKRRRRRKHNTRPRWLSVILNVMPNGLWMSMQRL
jgi:hypothetical protein